MNKGFTLIELAVVITIIAVLSGIILFSVKQYTDKGKDSNISGNLAVLVPAGEVYYNGNSYSYEGFCDPTETTGNSAMRNAISQMPLRSSGAPCYSQSMTATTNPEGVCCYVESSLHQAWAACAQKFTDATKAYCVDSRGIKKEMKNTCCTETITQCPDITSSPQCF